MWKYDQSSGELSQNGKVVSRGYSGNGRGKNNPSLQGVQGVGPIPRGRYKFTQRYDSPNVGPYVLRIEAQDGKIGDDTEASTGRGAFRMHGDSIKAPGTASKGCIIMPKAVRLAVWTSGDRDLEVVA